MVRVRKKNQSDEKLIQEGKSALRRDYHQSMTSFAKEILQQAKEEGFEDYDEAREWIDEQIHQTADGTSWVIYTANALDVLVASDNWTAMEDQGLGGTYGDNIAEMITAAAFWAVRQDISEYVDSYEDEYFTETENNPRRSRKKKRSKKKRSKKSRKRNPLLSNLLK